MILTIDGRFSSLLNYRKLLSREAFYYEMLCLHAAALTWCLFVLKHKVQPVFLGIFMSLKCQNANFIFLGTFVLFCHIAFFCIFLFPFYRLFSHIISPFFLRFFVTILVASFSSFFVSCPLFHFFSRDSIFWMFFLVSPYFDLFSTVFCPFFWFFSQDIFFVFFLPHFFDIF